MSKNINWVEKYLTEVDIRRIYATLLTRLCDLVYFHYIKSIRSSKELIFCLNLKSSNPYIFETWARDLKISTRNSLNPTLRHNLWPNSDDSLCHVIDSCNSSARLKELGPIKIKPTLVGFKENKAQCRELFS